MREIKFRGKRVDNGEWEYGDLLTSDEKTYIVNDCETICPDGEGTDLYALEWCEVEPETVGQYTGLTDKNGVEIYEGDVLSISCYSYEEPEEDYEGVVLIGCFGNGLLITNDDGTTKYLYLNELVGSYTTIYEVIGNIHQNPDLLAKEE
jgi:uncharacterized phage protein (TIGR01671 family)